MWNCIAYVFRVGLEGKIGELGVRDLLGFVNLYFPLKFLKYEQVSSSFMR